MKNNIFYESIADDIHYFNFHYAVGNVVPAHFHSNTEMLFVAKGNVKVMVNGKEAILGKNDIVISKGFDVHYYLGEEDSEVYVLVYGDIYKKMSPYDKNNKVYENFLFAREGTEEVFSLLEFFYSHSENASFELKIGFINFLHGLLEKFYSDKILKTKNVENELAKILIYVQENSNRDIKIDEVARMFGYSKNYFSILFNKITGMYFRDYLNRVRLEKMESLMKNDKSISVCSAALSCGFNSLNTYYRAKKKFE